MCPPGGDPDRAGAPRVSWGCHVDVWGVSYKEETRMELVRHVDVRIGLVCHVDVWGVPCSEEDNYLWESIFLCIFQDLPTCYGTYNVPVAGCVLAHFKLSTDGLRTVKRRTTQPSSSQFSHGPRRSLIWTQCRRLSPERPSLHC